MASPSRPPKPTVEDEWEFTGASAPLSDLNQHREKVKMASGLRHKGQRPHKRSEEAETVDMVDANSDDDVKVDHIAEAVAANSKRQDNDQDKRQASAVGNKIVKWLKNTRSLQSKTTRHSPQAKSPRLPLPQSTLMEGSPPVSSQEEADNTKFELLNTTVKPEDAVSFEGENQQPQIYRHPSPFTSIIKMPHMVFHKANDLTSGCSCHSRAPDYPHGHTMCAGGPHCKCKHNFGLEDRKMLAGRSREDIKRLEMLGMKVRTGAGVELAERCCVLSAGLDARDHSHRRKTTSQASVISSRTSPAAQLDEAVVRVDADQPDEQKSQRREILSREEHLLEEYAQSLCAMKQELEDRVKEHQAAIERLQRKDMTWSRNTSVAPDTKRKGGSYSDSVGRWKTPKNAKVKRSVSLSQGESKDECIAAGVPQADFRESLGKSAETDEYHTYMTSRRRWREHPPQASPMLPHHGPYPSNSHGSYDDESGSGALPAAHTPELNKANARNIQDCLTKEGLTLDDIIRRVDENPVCQIGGYTCRVSRIYDWNGASSSTEQAIAVSPINSGSTMIFSLEQALRLRNWTYELGDIQRGVRETMQCGTFDDFVNFRVI